ncbi:actin depolymerizing factor2, partial [Zea mays]
AGELVVRPGGERRVQGEVPGSEGAAELPVHRVQDRRQGHGDQGGPPRRAEPGLRRLHRQPPRRRVPLRHLRPRLHHRRELPEEQDLLLLLEQDAVRQLQGQVQEGAGRHPVRDPGHRPQRDEPRHRQEPDQLIVIVLLSSNTIDHHLDYICIIIVSFINFRPTHC